MSKLSVNDFAQWINEHYENYDYWEAIGLLKETRVMWEKKSNYDLLCEGAQIIFDDITGVND